MTPPRGALRGGTPKGRAGANNLLGRLASPQIPPSLDVAIDHDLVSSDEADDFDLRHITNGWALQDSNLGASGYEPGALPLS